ncbi:chromate efflux transporter [Thermodesulfovibrio sp.]|jgi:chromate transporter|uniref:chromate efflux transporter n=1 Tax=Thermodesulfovibrio TaxID=28261 RepID=UPI002636A4DE|nr:chromate efflux transporter [Thermodesulfovibrio sp.]
MVNLKDLFVTFLKLGLTAFGGPAMVAYIREVAVERKQWLDEKTFHGGIALAQAIPGATAMQVAAYVGLKTRGILGGLVSFVGFGMPAFLLMLFLSFLYEKTRSVSEIISVFMGLQIVVVAIIANAFLMFTKPILKSKGELLIAFLSFLLFTLKFNPFLIILICLLLSQLIFKEETIKIENNSKKVNLRGMAILLIALLFLLLLLFISDKTLFNIAITMIKIDCFAFGGAYASLPLMLHEFVDRLKWIDEKTFMDGIALGQITPGPIVITATFVGYLLKGYIGAIIATLAIFSPSFLIMALASEIDGKIKNSKIFSRAKKGLIASFSGLLLFATIKFAYTLEWNWIKLLFLSVSIFCLIKKINILYVVIIGATISAFVFK